MPCRKIEMFQVFCCNEDCDVPGPMAATFAGAMFDARMVGWEVLMNLTICPRCWSEGRLPSDVDDIRVTTVPEPAAVVEGR